MNYLILDTEKTYNFGVIVFNDKESILYERNFVIKERFEDRKICGEQTYNSKVKFFLPEDYCNAIQFLTQLSSVIKTYNIKTIIGHNVQEDKRNIAEIYLATEPFLAANAKINLDTIYFLDSISVIKLFFNDQLLNLEAVIEDILGFKFKQNHLAIEDAKLVSYLLVPLAKYLHLFENKEELDFIKSIKNEKVMSQHIGKILFNKTFKAEDIFQESGDFTIKTLNTRLARMCELNLLSFKETPKISEATGKPLKTMTKIYSHKDSISLEAISEFITSAAAIKEQIIKNVVLNARANNESLDAEIEKVKNFYKKEYDLKVKTLQEKEKALASKEKNLDEEVRETIKVKQDYTNKRKEVIQEVTQELYNKFNLDIKAAINETNIFSKKVKVILEKIINDLNKPQ